MTHVQPVFRRKVVVVLFGKAHAGNLLRQNVVGVQQHRRLVCPAARHIVLRVAAAWRKRGKIRCEGKQREGHERQQKNSATVSSVPQQRDHIECFLMYSCLPSEMSSCRILCETSKQWLLRLSELAIWLVVLVEEKPTSGVLPPGQGEFDGWI